MAGCDSCSSDNIQKATKQQRRVLFIVLLINATMFFVEFSAGLISHSTALMADSLDMLADALVYALGLFALGRAAYWKNRAALTSGIFQMILGLGILIQPIYLLSTNNVGVLIAAGLVYWLSSPLPDIVIGLFIAIIVMRSVWDIIKEARANVEILEF